MKYIIANWKMNKTLKEADQFIKQFNPESQHKIIIASPATILNHLNNITNIELASQDISQHEQGPHTGEISAKQVKEFADYTLIAHSERRHQETNNSIQQKILQAEKHNLTPILCIGETEQEKQIKQEILKQQLEPATENTIIAYEPRWAIGTGKTPTLEEINQTIEFIKQIKPLKVLYGGSVSKENSAEILEISDGLLVGSASLDSDSFKSIISTN